MSDETFSPPSDYITPPEGWIIKRHVTAPRTYYYTNTALSHRISWSIYKELWAVSYNLHNYYFLTLEEAFEAVNEGLD